MILELECDWSILVSNYINYNIRRCLLLIIEFVRLQKFDFVIYDSHNVNGIRSLSERQKA